MPNQVVNVVKNYDEVAVRSKDVFAYRIFGWVRSKKMPEVVKTGKNAKNVVMKRKLGYGENPQLASVEKQYMKLNNRKYRNKPILGIISFVLMLVFFVVAAFEIYVTFGKVSEEATGFNKTIYDIDTKYVAKNVDPLFKGTKIEVTDEQITVNEETEAETVAAETKLVDSEGNEVVLAKEAKVYGGEEGAAKYVYANAKVICLPDMLSGINEKLTTELVIGAVAFVLFVIFLILFIAVATISKRRAANEAKKMALQEQATSIMNYMAQQDPSLLTKAKRKEMMWTNIIANGIRQAGLNTNNNINVFNSQAEGGDDEDEFDF